MFSLVTVWHKYNRPCKITIRVGPLLLFRPQHAEVARANFLLPVQIQRGGEVEGHKICCANIDKQTFPKFYPYFQGFWPNFPNFFSIFLCNYAIFIAKKILRRFAPKTTTKIFPEILRKQTHIYVTKNCPSEFCRLKNSLPLYPFVSKYSRFHGTPSEVDPWPRRAILAATSSSQNGWFFISIIFEMFYFKGLALIEAGIDAL